MIFNLSLEKKILSENIEKVSELRDLTLKIYYLMNFLLIFISNKMFLYQAISKHMQQIKHKNYTIAIRFAVNQPKKKINNKTNNYIKIL